MTSEGRTRNKVEIRCWEPPSGTGEFMLHMELIPFWPCIHALLCKKPLERPFACLFHFSKVIKKLHSSFWLLEVTATRCAQIVTCLPHEFARWSFNQNLSSIPQHKKKRNIRLTRNSIQPFVRTAWLELLDIFPPWQFENWENISCARNGPQTGYRFLTEHLHSKP